MTAELAGQVDVDAAVDRFGCAIRAFVQGASRSTLSASLFDVPRRSEMASVAYYDCVAPYLRQVEAAMPAARVGELMRRPALRPNSLHVVGTIWLMLFRREQMRLAGDGAWRARDEEIAEVVRFNVRALEAARHGAPFIPLAPELDMPLLDEQTAGALATRTMPVDEERRRAVRKLTATLELYSFVLHGENRDGSFAHGPYPLADDRWLLVRDFTDLRNTSLPWSTETTRLPVGSVTVALVGQLGDVEVDLWGTAHRPDGDLWDSVTHAAAFVASDDELVEVDAARVAALTADARRAQLEIFRSVIAWPPEQREQYGVTLFANYLTPIGALAGLAPEAGDEMIAAMKRAARAYEPSPSGRWAVWRHLAEGEGSPFATLEAAG